MRCGPQRRVKRSATIRRSLRGESRDGETCGRELRSVSGSPTRYRAAHFDTVVGEHWNRSAARRTDQPSSTTSFASRRLPSAVNGVLP
jgi:hypothetical protein